MNSFVALLVLAQICSFTLGRCAPPCGCDDICNGKLELGIVLDSSSSISREDFKKGQNFLQEFVTKFKIASNGVRVSIITYGRYVHPEDSFNLTTYSKGEDVSDAIGRLPHHAEDYTATGKGINFMRDRQLSNEFVRNGVPRVGLVITDGDSQEPLVTASEALQAREQGIVLFAIGVGHKIKYEELYEIAGEDARVHKIDSYEKLTTIVDTLAKETCIKK